jgi:hypothetical protein
MGGADPGRGDASSIHTAEHGYGSALPLLATRRIWFESESAMGSCEPAPASGVGRAGRGESESETSLAWEFIRERHERDNGAAGRYLGVGTGPQGRHHARPGEFGRMGQVERMQLHLLVLLTKAVESGSRWLLRSGGRGSLCSWVCKFLFFC